jgi:hypothetical protein
MGFGTFWEAAILAGVLHRCGSINFCFFPGCVVGVPGAYANNALLAIKYRCWGA